MRTQTNGSYWLFIKLKWLWIENHELNSPNIDTVMRIFYSMKTRWQFIDFFLALFWSRFESSEMDICVYKALMTIYNINHIMVVVCVCGGQWNHQSTYRANILNFIMAWNALIFITFSSELIFHFITILNPIYSTSAS